jgi:DNA-binding GntR family transcriptional regulator
MPRMKRAARSDAKSSTEKSAGARAKPVKAGRVSLVERAYVEIRRRILDNEYPPSHQMLELDLAAELSMSRTPVREALVRLQNESFVQLIPRHGMRVVPLSVVDLYEMYEVLTALELTAIERLAKAHLDDAALASIRATVDDMDAALKRHDVEAWAKADQRFHRMLVGQCGNSRLVAMADTLWDQGHRARMTTVRLRPALQQSNEEHRAVVDAVVRGDWRAANTLYRRHRDRTSTEIIKLLEQTGLARK